MHGACVCAHIIQAVDRYLSLSLLSFATRVCQLLSHSSLSLSLFLTLSFSLSHSPFWRLFFSFVILYDIPLWKKKKNKNFVVNLDVDLLLLIPHKKIFLFFFYFRFPYIYFLNAAIRECVTACVPNMRPYKWLCNKKQNKAFMYSFLSLVKYLSTEFHLKTITKHQYIVCLCIKCKSVLLRFVSI